MKRGSLASLDSMLDTSAYLRHTSDIVALPPQLQQRLGLLLRPLEDALLMADPCQRR